MPKTAIESLRRERDRLANQPARPEETTADRRCRESKLVFAMADRFLDRAIGGPMHLKDPDAAQIVDDRIMLGAGVDYDLFAWCVMVNHVHVLLEPRGELRGVTQGLKGATAFRINGLQGERGRTFWQDESYDHWVRDEEEMVSNHRLH